VAIATPAYQLEQVFSLGRPPTPVCRVFAAPELHSLAPRRTDRKQPRRVVSGKETSRASAGRSGDYGPHTSKTLARRPVCGNPQLASSVKYRRGVTVEHYRCRLIERAGVQMAVLPAFESCQHCASRCDVPFHSTRCKPWDGSGTLNVKPS
jgi:hypothetical protein